MKYLRVTLVTTIAFSLLLAPGCATVKSFFTSAQTMACNPTPAVVEVVTAAVPILATAVSIAVPGTQAWVAAYGAQNIANVILSGACVSLDQLNALIAYLSSDAAKVAQAKMAVVKMKKGVAVTRPLDINPLVIWANSSK